MLMSAPSIATEAPTMPQRSGRKPSTSQSQASEAAM